MDITSKISLATAIIEFIVVAWAYFKFERTPLSNLVVTLLILLGLTQFCEYQLCNSANLIWGRIGFVIYIIIPSLILSYALKVVLKKNTLLIYIPYLAFALTAIFQKLFVISSECSRGLSSVINTFFFGREYISPSIINFFYVGIFSILSAVILFRGAKASTLIYEKYIFKLIGGTVLVSFVVPTILVIFFPGIRLFYPSIIERFLTAYLFTGIISLYLEQKIIAQTKIKNPEY